MRWFCFCLFLLFLIQSAFATRAGQNDIGRLILAIKNVETRGQPNNGDHAKNKYSSARGPLQITKGCWQSAIKFDPSIGGSFSDCDHLPYSIKIFHANMRNFVPKAYKSGDFETMARVWNQGLGGMNNRDATIYWGKVKKELSN